MNNPYDGLCDAALECNISYFATLYYRGVAMSAEANYELRKLKEQMIINKQEQLENSVLE